MKRSTKQLLSALLVIAMMLSLLVVPAVAADEPAAGEVTTYIADMADVGAFAALPAGETKTLDAEGFFTVIGGGKIKSTASTTKYDDNYKASFRLQTSVTHEVGGTGDSAFPANCVMFEPEGKATLKLWWRSGSSSGTRYLAVWDKDGKEIAKTESAVDDSTTPHISTLEIPAGGPYYIVSPANGCNIDKMTAAVAKPTETRNTYTADMADVGAFAALPAGETKTLDTDGFFTVIGGGKIKSTASTTKYDDNYKASFRLQTSVEHQVGGTGDHAFPANCVMFEPEGKTTLKLWWRSGSSSGTRYLAVWDKDGKEIAKTESAVDDSTTPHISTLEIPAAGTYYIVSPANGCNIDKMEAVEIVPPGPEPEKAIAPWTLEDICRTTGGKINVTAEDDKKGGVKITVDGPQVGTFKDKKANVIYTCADDVTVVLADKAGKEVASKVFDGKANKHTVTFNPTATGDYTVKVSVNRKGETPFTPDNVAVSFVLPLATPVIKSVTSAGGGKMSLVWGAVAEATGYNVYMGDATTPVNAAPVTATTYMVEGLTVGEKYTFKVEALRGTEKTVSEPSAETTATQDAQRVWNFASYGPSSSLDREVMGYSGSANEGETLDLWSLKGNGKLKKGSDGLAFYYTEVPNDENFCLKAKIHVNYWAYSGAQEGFGIMAADTMQNVDQAASGGVGAGKDKDYWTNNHMIAVTKTESDSDGFSVSGRLGIMMYSETGVTSDPRKDPGAAMVNYNTNLDARAVSEKMSGVKFYNIVGNLGGVDGKEHDKYEPNDSSGQPEFPANANVVNFDTYTANRYPLVTDFWMELKRTNDGYFATWYDADGKTVIKTASRPHPNLDFSADADVLAQEDALLKQDPSTVNVGFIAARHAHVTVSDVTFNTTKKTDDPMPVPPPTKIIKPTIKMASSTNANSEDYNLVLTSNVVGTAVVKLNGAEVKLASGEPIKVKIQPGEYTEIKYGDRRADVPLKLKEGSNSIEVVFTPADESEQLYSYAWSKIDEKITSVTINNTITFDNKRADRVNIYVAPNGSATGTGSKDRPMTLPAAVKVVQPGQKIVLMEGTYRFTATIELPNGVNGKPGEMIYMIADPEATSRPVLDFMSRANVGVKVNGDYWYLEGFDVTRSLDRSAGINVGGHYNTLSDLRTYLNGNSGIQISRASSADGNLDTWPSNNLILNCVSFLNADAGNEDADGFAAKLTCGPGNVFRGCISAYNADDGWDLYAKSTTTGPIGQVTLENCVTFKNGILLVDAADTSANPRPVMPREGMETREIPTANGNGFKLGGENLSGHHTLRNSYAFWNKGKGIDCNSCPDIEVYNCVSFSNGNSNVALYSSSNTAFKVQGLVSFKDDTAPQYPISTTANGGKDVYEKLEPKEQATTADYKNDTTFYWEGGKTVNAGGKAVDAASLFEDVAGPVSITYDKATRTYSLGDFLKLKADADKTVGSGILPNDNPGEPTIPGGKPDTTVDPTLDPEDPPKKSSGGRDDLRGDTSTTEPGKTDVTTTVEKKTNAAGDRVITVTDSTGEVLVDLTLPTKVPTTDKKFVDVPEDHWAADAITEMAARGLVKGVDEEHFSTNADVTRGTLATMLFRLSNGKEGYENKFADVKGGAWYTDAVAWASKAGVVTGYGDGTFAPDTSINREQLALMLYRYAKLVGVDTTAKTADLTTFGDAAQVSDWAAEGMNWAVANGIINGTGNNALSPKASATRAQTALMLQRFIALVK